MVPASTFETYGFDTRGAYSIATLPLARDEAADARFQLLPGEIDDLAAGQVIERAGLDPVHQLGRLARGRDHVEEPPRAGRPRLQVEHAPGQDVAAPEVVEQPAVEAEFPQALLNGGTGRTSRRISSCR